MLLCEVALGNVLKQYEGSFIEKLKPAYQSVQGCGARGPDYENGTLFTP